MVKTRYWGGRALKLGGALLTIVAFFSPWFEVYKLNDPSYVFPRRGYSPWMVIQSGQRDMLGLAAWLFALLIAGMALSSAEYALTRTPRRRERAWMRAGMLALVGMLMAGLALAMIPFDLSFFWPFLSSEIVYGSYLALAGMLCVIVSVGLDAAVRPPAHQTTLG